MSQRQRIAFALMVAGVALYAIYHVWKAGWRVWLGIIDLIGMPEYWDPELLIAISAFVCLPIPVLGAPICFAWLSRSRLLRFMLAGFAAVGSLTFFILWLTTFGFRKPEFLLLASAPLFSLIGLITIKPSPPVSVLENPSLPTADED